MKIHSLILSLFLFPFHPEIFAQNCSKANNVDHFYGNKTGVDETAIKLGIFDPAGCKAMLDIKTSHSASTSTDVLRYISTSPYAMHTWLKGNPAVPGNPLNFARIAATTTENTFTLYDLQGSAGNVKLSSSTSSYLLGGNLGIGTTTPNARLHVTGSRSAHDINLTGPGGFIVLRDTLSPAATPAQAQTELAMDNNEIMVRSANGGGVATLNLQGDGGAVSIHGGLDNAQKIQITELGRVGIGITNPSAPLHLRQFADNGLRFQRDDGTHDQFEIRLAGSTGLQVWNATDNQYIMTFNNDGKVGIGTTTIPAAYKLAVNGSVIATELKVKLQANWPDHIFESDYPLLPLSELEKSILQNCHLPGIPSAAEVEANGGVEVGDMQQKLLQKVEELTLYLIELKKENEELRRRVEALEN